MKIDNSSPADLEMILDIYRTAGDYQRRNGYNMWPEFDGELIEKEISEARHYKISEGGQIACVFTIAYNDPLIWEEKDLDAALYLHRIATNVAFKGKSMMQRIIWWAKDHARAKGIEYIRMDTWADNEKLKDYYVSCGFVWVRQKQLPQQNALPKHYWGTSLSLFEITA